MIFKKDDIIQCYHQLSLIRERNMKDFLPGRIDMEEYLCRLAPIKNVQSFLDSGFPISIDKPENLTHEA